MMKTTSALGLTLGLAAFTTFAFAQPQDPANESGSVPTGGRHGEHRPHPADANEDGLLTTEEFNRFHQEVFSKSDANGDGQLDRDEVLSLRQHLPGREGRIPPAPGPQWRSGKEGRRHHDRPNPDQIISSFDENEDGALQESEVPEGMAAHFSRMDADGNGAISLEELEQAKPDPEKMKARFQERLKAMDTNEDGMIQADEAQGPMRKHFARMDANGDGSIDQEELAAMREKMRSRSGDDGHRRHGRHGQNETSDDSPATQPSENPAS